MTISSPQIVAVHGATGPQGATVARALLAAGHSVRALARTPVTGRNDRVAGAVVDLLDVESLVRAYRGAEAVFVHLPTVFDADRALRQADNIATALDRAGVARVVVNPNLVPPPTAIGVPYLDARVRVVQAATNGRARVSVVAPAAQYMENINAPFSSPRVIERGVLAYPLPADLAVPWVAQDDIAAVVAHVITDPEAPAMTVVSGPEALAGPQAAAELSTALNRALEWRTISGDEYRAMLAPHVGEEAASGIGALYDSVLSGQAPPPPPLDPSIVRTGATSLQSWARAQSWPYSVDLNQPFPTSAGAR